MQCTKLYQIIPWRKFAMLYLLFVALVPAYAHAAAITNLDEKAHELEANNQKITIAAEETWRIPGEVTINYQGREIHMEETDEYAIWNDHELGPQRHVNPGGGLTFR